MVMALGDGRDFKKILLAFPGVSQVNDDQYRCQQANEDTDAAPKRLCLMGALMVTPMGSPSILLLMLDDLLHDISKKRGQGDEKLEQKRSRGEEKQ